MDNHFQAKNLLFWHDWLWFFYFTLILENNNHACLKFIRESFKCFMLFWAWGYCSGIFPPVYPTVGNVLGFLDYSSRCMHLFWPMPVADITNWSQHLCPDIPGPGCRQRSQASSWPICFWGIYSIQQLFKCQAGVGNTMVNYKCHHLSSGGIYSLSGLRSNVPLHW